MKAFAIIVLLALATAGGIGYAVAHSDIDSVKGSGNLKSEDRILRDFTRVSISGAIEADVRVGSDYSVKIEADDNVLSHITTEVKGKELSVGMKGNLNLANSKVRVHITLPLVDGLEVSGASTVTATGIRSEQLKLDVDGASHATLSGEARSLACQLSGASTLVAESLLAQKVSVDCSGASNARVHADETIAIDASGASHVSYSGKAKLVSNETSGVSSVEQE